MCFEEVEGYALHQKRLQFYPVKTYDARIIFNAVINQNILAKTPLDANAPIVEDAAFEKAVLTIQSKIEDSLTAHERIDVVHLEKKCRNTVCEKICRSECVFCDESLERKKCRVEKSFNSAYLHVDFFFNF